MGCAGCASLKTDILEQVAAFEVLASLNSSLTWQLLAENIKAVASRHINGQGQPSQLEREVSPVEATESKSAAYGHSGVTGQDTTRSLGNKNGHTDDVLHVPVTKKTRHVPDCAPPDQDEIVSLSPPPLAEEEDPCVDTPGQSSCPVLNDETDNTLTLAKLKSAEEWIEKIGGGRTKVFKCLKCQRTMSRMDSAKLHVRRIHFGDRLACSNCPAKFYNVTYLKKHASKCPGTKSKSVPPLPAAATAKSRKKPLAQNKTERKKMVNNQQKVDRLVVRNPCKNFNLKKSLTAQVKLERMKGQGGKRKKLTKPKKTTSSTAAPQNLKVDFVTWRHHPLKPQREDGALDENLPTLVDFGPYEVVDVHGGMRKKVRLEFESRSPQAPNGGGTKSGQGRRVSSRLLDRKMDDLMQPVILMSISDDENNENFTNFGNHHDQPLLKMEGGNYENFDQFEERQIFKQEPEPLPPLICIEDQDFAGDNLDNGLSHGCHDNQPEAGAAVDSEVVKNIFPSDNIIEDGGDHLTLQQQDVLVEVDPMTLQRDIVDTVDSLSKEEQSLNCEILS